MKLGWLVKRQEITFRDMVAAEGRNEAQKYLRERLSDLDAEFAQKERDLKECERQMKDAESKKRIREIRAFFASALSDSALALDVRLDGKPSLRGLNIGRGSEGPRGLAAYYYAFLSTVRMFGSSAFCPIVIDAPNQQGQDKGHLKKIMEFLLSKAPDDAQVVIGAETVDASAGANVIDVTWKKNQVLREDKYSKMLVYFRPYLQEPFL